MKAIGYIRRSKKSDEKAVSLDVQAEAVRAYAGAHSLEVAEVICDDGVSGGKRARLRRLREAIEKTGAKAVVVYHLDRFARDIAGLLEEVKAYNEHGINLYACDRGRIDIDSASGFLMTGVEALLAEHYRRLISEKTKRALAHRREQGLRISRFIPYGFTLGIDKRSLISNPEQQEVKAYILELGRLGLGARRIRATLEDEGISPPPVMTIHDMIRRNNENPRTVTSA